MKSTIMFFLLFGGLSNLFYCSPRSTNVTAPPIEAVKPAKVTSAPKPGETDIEAQLRQAKDSVRELSGDLASKQKLVEALTADRDRERNEAFLGALRASCLWVAGVALLGALACGALAFISPIAKTTLVKVSVACGALVILATGCAWAVPWLPTLGVVALIAIVCCVIIAALFAAVRWFPSFAKAAIHSADGYQQAVSFLRLESPDLATEVDRENRVLQFKNGGMVFREGDRLHAVAAKFRASECDL